MLKRFLAILIVCILLLPAATASADVVWGNDFLDRNRDEVQPMNRLFIVNGPNGHVSAKVAPGSKKEEAAYVNGDLILIGSIYLHKGRYWGIPPISHMYYGNGWILMDELLMVYDHIDFVSEHQEELYAYTGSAGRILESEGYYVWRWPGSDMQKRHYLTEYMQESDFVAQNAYNDNEGREWVYFRISGGESFGGLSQINAATGWICLDDVDNSTLPAFNPAPEPIHWSGEEVPVWYRAPDQPSSGSGGNDENGGNGTDVENSGNGTDDENSGNGTDDENGGNGADDMNSGNGTDYENGGDSGKKVDSGYGADDESGGNGISDGNSFQMTLLIIITSLTLICTVAVLIIVLHRKK